MTTEPGLNFFVNYDERKANYDFNAVHPIKRLRTPNGIAYETLKDNNLKPLFNINHKPNEMFPKTLKTKVIPIQLVKKKVNKTKEFAKDFMSGADEYLEIKKQNDAVDRPIKQLEQQSFLAKLTNKGEVLRRQNYYGGGNDDGNDGGGGGGPSGRTRSNSVPNFYQARNQNESSGSGSGSGSRKEEIRNVLEQAKSDEKKYRLVSHETLDKIAKEINVKFKSKDTKPTKLDKLLLSINTNVSPVSPPEQNSQRKKKT